MIDRNSITNFIYKEEETSAKQWKKLMDLPLSDRIRKRKAIANVKLVNAEIGNSVEDSLVLFKVTTEQNVADFKEGECLLLHLPESLIIGIKCVLFSFNDDKEIILGTFKLDKELFDSYKGKDLVLDKDLVDLKDAVYDPFIFELPGQWSNYWTDSFLNTMGKPTFGEKEENKVELNDTIHNFKLNLLDAQYEAILNSMSTKDYYLIQGPPGTGKTFVLGIIILEEILYFHHKVGVSGPNHNAINNILEQVLKICPGLISHVFKVGKTYNSPKHEFQYDGKKLRIKNGSRINSENANSSNLSWIIGLTPYTLYTNSARGLHFDTLIIDEGAQMSIPLAMMGILKTKKIIIAGDHKQLPPIITSDKIEPEMCQSVFQRLINEDNSTMLNVSFRMCEPICNFVSGLFYDGKLEPYQRGCGNLVVDKDILYDFHCPVIFKDIKDDGLQFSDGEAKFISNVIGGFLKRGLSSNQLAVISPFRAQVANIRRWVRKDASLPKQESNIVIDTVDKMQGQEADVIIYSMTSGSYDYMTEMSDFLYNPQKLNVAFSRAKSKLIIVGNMEQLKKISTDKNIIYIKKILESEYIKII